MAFPLMYAISHTDANIKGTLLLPLPLGVGCPSYLTPTRYTPSSTRTGVQGS